MNLRDTTNRPADLKADSNGNLKVAQAGAITAVTLLSAVIVTGAGTALSLPASTKTFQASGTTSASTGAATVLIQGSLNGTNWDTVGTISLTLGTASTSDSFISYDRYLYHRANVTAISGTDATVSAIAAY